MNSIDSSGVRCGRGPWRRPVWSRLRPCWSVTVAPIRGWAEDLLSIFRVEHVAVLDINSSSIKGLENDTVFNQAMSRFISEEVTVTQAPQKPQPVADAATAAKIAGFDVHLLAGQTPASLTGQEHRHCADEARPRSHPVDR